MSLPADDNAASMPPAFHMFPHARGFNARNAYSMALAAELVYEESTLIEAIALGRWQFERVAYINEDDTQAFVATNDRCTLVSFRGTEPGSLADWLTDANTALVPGPFGGKVHGGFYWSLGEVWKIVNDCVADFDHGMNKPLWLTGHSLGGALATLAAARWLAQRRPVQGIYTFGQPRSGDFEFARQFNFAFRPHAFRFVNNNDLVTRVPPQSLGYSHSGTFKYFMENGRFAEGIGWWRKFLDGWRGRIDDLMGGRLDAVDDHSMIHYRDRLAQLVAPLNPLAAPQAGHHIRPRRRSA